MRPGSRFAERKTEEPDSRVILTEYRGKIVAAHLNRPGQLLSVLPCSEESPLLGRIYTGRVSKVLTGLDACFVSIGDRDLFLPYGECNLDSPVCGSILTVQVSREAVKTKEPSATCYPSLAGKYVVVSLSKGSGKVSVSSKLPDPDLRRTYREQLTGLLSGKAFSFDLIVRTNAAQASDDEVLREAEALLTQLETILQNAQHRTLYSLMYEPEKPYVSFLRDIPSDLLAASEVITDLPAVYEALLQGQKDSLLPAALKLRLYQDPAISLQKLYRFDHLMDEVLSKRVWLKSGGFLVIEQTEALNVIDVNTGKSVPGRKQAEVIRAINLEAAQEAARQIRLRNLSGMILIDFINDTPEGQKILWDRMLSELKSDRIRTTLVDITKLGLFEITRQRRSPSLKELFGQVLLPDPDEE